MNDPTMEGQSAANIADEASASLLRAGALAAPTGPILRQLLTGERDGLFSDAIIARTSAMISHLAHQMAFAVVEAAEEAEPLGAAAAEAEILADALAEQLRDVSDVLGHVHALCVESTLADMLHERAAIDPALPPLLKDLLTNQDAEIAAAAMHVLAAQARFLHHSRRMELPLGELPGELFALCLSLIGGLGTIDPGQREAVRSMLAANYDEGGARTSQIARLAMLAHDDSTQKPSLPNSGLAIFASWLALDVGKPRDDTILAIGQRDLSRLVLMMRAADLSEAAMQGVVAILAPHGTLDPALASLAPEEARQLLSGYHGAANT